MTKTTTPTLYDEIKATGIPLASHESDLYVPATDQVREILARYPQANANKTTFRNQVEGGIWYDVPFAYQPFWDTKAKGQP